MIESNAINKVFIKDLRYAIIRSYREVLMNIKVTIILILVLPNSFHSCLNFTFRKYIKNRKNYKNKFVEFILCMLFSWLFIQQPTFTKKKNYFKQLFLFV